MYSHQLIVATTQDADLKQPNQTRNKSKMTEATTNPLAGLWKPTHLKALYYGPDSVAKYLLSTLPTSSSKAFIVTGNSLATKTQLIKQVEQLLGPEHHAGTFSKIGEHAPVAQLDEATEVVKKDPHIDTIISIGGGSPIDSAKAISHRVHEKTGKYLYHITVPTTLSAAECTSGAGYTEKNGVKTGVAGPELAPDVIIYDAKFGLETPPHLWLSTGFRAMDHAVECLYHPTATEIMHLMALQAASSLFTYLPKYKDNPKDEDVITQLQLAAFASLGFLGLNTKGSLGLSHTLGYALGSPYGIPHGITSCLTLGHVMQLKAEDPVAAKGIARLTPFIGNSRSGDDKKDAVQAGESILHLVKDLGLKTTLKEKGVGEDQVLIIVKRATGGIESGPVYDKVAELVRKLY
jgi:alcohol dehydrogenase class IV